MKLSLKLLDEKDGGRAVFSVMEDFSYEIEGKKIFIKKGFKTDLASIPRLFHAFVSPTDSRWRCASVCHDYFFRGGEVNFLGKNYRPNVWESNRLFFQIMRRGKKMPLYLAVLFFLGVSAFGWLSYQK